MELDSKPHKEYLLIANVPLRHLYLPFSSAEDLKTICETNEVDFIYYPLEGRGHGPWGATVNGKSLSDLSFDFIVDNQNLNVE